MEAAACLPPVVALRSTACYVAGTVRTIEAAGEQNRVSTLAGTRVALARHGLAPAAALALLLVACGPGLSPVESVLGPVTVAMAGGEESSLAVAVPESQAVRITIEPTTIDVRATVRDASGRTVLDVDAPARAAGTEVLLMQPGPARTLTLTVTGIDYPTSRGEVRIEAVALPSATESDRERIAAAGLESAASARVERIDERHARRAATQFAEAASFYEGLNDDRAAARGRLHQAAVHEWRLWDHSGAIEHAREAARHARRARDHELTAHALALIGAAQTGQADSMRQAGTAEAATREFDQSRASLTQAAQLYAELELDSLEALTVNYRGVAAQYAGDWQAAEADYRQAGEIWQALGDTARTSLPLQSLAFVYYEQGDPRRALELFDQALALQKGMQLIDYAHTLHNSAMACQVLGRFDEAIARYYEAMQILAAAGDRPGQARALHGIGVALKAAGEPERAEVMLERSLALRPAGSDDRSRHVALVVLGDLHRERGDNREAVGLHTEAITIATSPHEEARGRVALARDYLATAAYEDAKRELDLALALPLPETHRYRASAWLELGEVEAALGHDEASDAAFARALRIHSDARSDLEQAYVLERRARVAFTARSLERVVADTGAALALLNRVSLEGTHGDQRALFLASRRSTVELRLETFMALAQAAAREGDLKRAASLERLALAVSEASRGIALRDRLRADGEAAVSGALLDRRRKLYELLVGKRARQDALQERAAPDVARVAVLAEEIEHLRTELDSVEARVGLERRQAGTSTTVDEPAALLEAPPGTVVAEYFIGERNSWLFELRGDELDVHRLPARSELEPLAHRLHERWQSPAGGSDRSLAAADPLARMLFAPLHAAATDDALLIVPDGALYLIPLAVLVRRSQAAALAKNVSIVPSLAALRDSTGARPPAPRLLAMIADPIFSGTDPRVHDGHAVPRSIAHELDAGLTRSARTLESLTRLPGAEIEAREVLELVPREQTLVLTGAEATRERLLTAPLDQYRILHFATHAWSDSQDPALATLVLSRLDVDGRPQDGALRLSDIAGLRLNADLVVLSGCETALGREIAGEGPVSLSQGFLRAGARAVVASLWRVPDTSTTVLMRHFYEHLLRDRRSPAEALGLAQDAVRSQRRWADPYFWAGFQLTEIAPRT